MQTIKNNFALVQLGVVLIAQPDAPQRYDEALEAVKDHPETPSFSYIKYVFETDDLLKHATKEFRNAVLRNCLKETFELLKTYGDATNQAAIIKAAS